MVAQAGRQFEDATLLKLVPPDPGPVPQNGGPVGLARTLRLSTVTLAPREPSFLPATFPIDWFNKRFDWLYTVLRLLRRTKSAQLHATRPCICKECAQDEVIVTTALISTENTSKTPTATRTWVLVTRIVSPVMARKGAYKLQYELSHTCRTINILNQRASTSDDY
ncbi:hypothetical protein DPSP01_014745 [Paraphaeosphaeria sporulosa]